MPRDIVERLRDRAYSGLPDPLLAEAADEIERLRNGALADCETVTLTDAEREAIETAMNAYGSDNANPECAAIEATLWGLLERTRQPQNA